MKELIKAEDIFVDEIAAIESPLHKEIFLRCLKKVPDYFWIVPASSTGKYHPDYSLGVGGLLRHTKAVFKIANDLLGHSMFKDISDAGKDEVRVACLIHDMCKQGDGKGGHTVWEHPIVVRDMLRPWDEDKIVSDEMKDTWNNICDLVASHMGQWNTNKRESIILPTPDGAKANLVHLADYLASRKFIEVDVYKTEKKVETENWRTLPAKDTQLKYIDSLLDKCVASFIDPPEDILGIQLRDKFGNITIERGTASDVIGKLRKVLGMDS